MSKDKTRKQSIWKTSLWRAVLVVVIFILLDSFQDKNIIREGVEDVAFDVINKLIFSTQDQSIGKDVEVNKNRVTVFAFDNVYMRQKELFDKQDNATYGYSFPREEIAGFIHKLDQHLETFNPQGATSNCTKAPKALFIDFDLTHTTGANNTCSTGDKALIKILSRPHCYKILLAKSSPYHYIEQAAKHKPALQAQIDHKNIIFVSPYFHGDDNGVVRRYLPIKAIDQQVYPTAAIALWQLFKYGATDNQQARRFIDDAKQVTQKSVATSVSDGVEKDRINVNANRILIRNYKNEGANLCPQRSYWKNLTKYSLSCDMSDIFPDRLDNTLLLLGGTEIENAAYHPEGDYQKVLKFLFADEKMSGVDIHANILMTLLYLDQDDKNVSAEQVALPIMQQLPLFVSLLIIFSLFLLLDSLNTWLLQYWKINNRKITFALSLIVNGMVLFLLSWYFLQAAGHFWFNWFVTLLIFQLLDVLEMIKQYLVMLYCSLPKGVHLVKKRLPILLKYLRRKK